MYLHQRINLLKIYGIPACFDDFIVFARNVKSFTVACIFSFFFSKVFIMIPQKIFPVFFSDFCLRRMWPISDFKITCRVVSSQVLRQSWTVMANLSESMWHLAFQPLKIYLHHYLVELPPINSYDFLITRSR